MFSTNSWAICLQVKGKKERREVKEEIGGLQQDFRSRSLNVKYVLLFCEQPQ